MAGNIKGITVEIGGDTSKLSTAMQSVNKDVKKTQSELNQVNRLLKFDPSNTTLLAQKQELLSKQIQNTSEKLKTLKQVQQQVNDQFASGKINGEQFRAFQREIAKAESDLKSFKSQASSTKISIEAKADTTGINKMKSKLKELGPAAKEAGKEIADGLGKAGAVGAAATGGLVTGMQEYNQDLARLRTNSQLAGNDMKLVENAFKQVTAVTGETDSAVETVSNLLATGFKDNQLEEMINQVNGAAIKFSDTLKTEGIADGIQETFKTGQATGPFAELLERSGVKLKAFNADLQAAQKEGKGTEFVMQTMSELGFGKVTEKYKEMNPEVQKNAEAQADLQAKLSNLAIVLSPIITKITELVAKLAVWASNNPGIATTIAVISTVLAGLAGAFAVLSPIISAVTAIWPVLAGAIGAITLPIGIAIGVITGLIAVGIALWKNWDSVKSFLSTVWEGIKTTATTVFSTIGNGIKAVWNGIKTFTSTVWNGIKSFISGLWNGIKSLASSAFNGVKSVITTIWNGIKSVTSSVWNAIKSVVSGVWNGLKSLASGVFNGIKSVISSIWNGIKSVTSSVWNSIKSVVSNVWNGIKSVVSTVINTVKSVISNGWSAAKNVTSTLVGGIKTVISNIFGKFKEVVSTAMSKVKDAISNGWNKAKNFLDGINLVSIGKNIIQGLINGIKNAAGSVASAIKGVADGAVKAAKNALGIHSPSRVFRDQVGWWISEGIAKGIEANTKAEKAAKAKAQAIIKSFNTDLKSLKLDYNAGSINTAEYIKSLKKLKKENNDYAIGVKTINAEINKVNNQSTKERFARDKTYYSNKSKLDSTSLQKELNILNETSKGYKKGSDERIYFENLALQKKEEITKAKKKVDEDYLANVKKLNDDYNKSLQEIKDAEEKTISDLAKSLYDFAGIFDEVNKNSEVSGEQLLANLQGQVTTFEQWQKSISDLSARGIISDGLVKELQDMGPKSAAEIAALNTLTDEQLTQYQALWKTKSELARTEAEKELAPLKANTEKQIEELKVSTATKLEEYQTKWKTSTEAITKGTKTEFKKMPSIGSYAVQGLIDGMNSKKAELAAVAAELASLVAGTTQSELDIHSPSRVMKKLGVYTNEGFIVGLQESAARLKNAMSNLYGSLANSAQTMMTGSSTVNSSTNSYDYSKNPSYTVQVNAASDAQIARVVRREFEAMAFKGV